MTKEGSTKIVNFMTPWGSVYYAKVCKSLRYSGDRWLLFKNRILIGFTFGSCRCSDNQTFWTEENCWISNVQYQIIVRVVCSLSRINSISSPKSGECSTKGNNCNWFTASFFVSCSNYSVKHGKTWWGEWFKVKHIVIIYLNFIVRLGNACG